jgi:hypothetical protein
MKRVIILFLTLFTAFNSRAQEKIYNRVDTIPVYQYGRQLLYPWVGGLNSPQFSAVTLDSLGVSLLVIFDRCGEHFYTFLNEGIIDSISYLYAPQYEKNFPVCHNWALLRDYNCDGIPDIFSSTYSGVDVYRGFYNSNHEWDFNMVSSQLEFPYSTYTSNVFVPGADIPAIDDIEGKGVMDILAFGPLGGYINYYKNTSEDSGHGCDSLNYVWQSPCWGNVFENYYLTMFLNVCGGFSGIPRSGEGYPDAVEHHAGNTICTFVEDTTGNDKSFLWGGITFPYSDFLHNEGLNDTAHVDWQDTTFPSYGVRDSIRSFPAAFSIDLNNDGYKDLLFAPNYTFGTEDYDNVRYYQQVPHKTIGQYERYYNYEGDSLFSKDMIDVGSGSAPAFFHYFNNDTSSIYDLVIGNINRYNINGIPDASLTLYRNIGSNTHPAFQLVSKDFASISRLGLTAIVPAFGDLRGTGTEDMILGNSIGTLYYFDNIAPVGSPAQYQLPQGDSGVFYDSISVGGGYSAPQLVDVDGDGLLDLIVGSEDGIIYYYHNDGTKAAPKFKLVSSNWGGVYVADEGYYTGNSNPFLYRDSTGKLILLVGSLNGTIFRYDSIENNINSGTFTLTDSAFSNINTGFLSQSTISGAKIFGNANPEIAVGNYRGGITIYTSSEEVKTAAIQQVQKTFINCSLYPNPANDEITISLTGVSEHDMVRLDVEDVLGRTLISTSVENYHSKVSLSISQLPVGIYFCRVQAGNNFVVRKFVVSR